MSALFQEWTAGNIILHVTCHEITFSQCVFFTENIFERDYSLSNKIFFESKNEL